MIKQLAVVMLALGAVGLTGASHRSHTLPKSHAAAKSNDDPGGPPDMAFDNAKAGVSTKLDPVKGGLKLAADKIAFEKTRLADIAKKTGATVRHKGDAGTALNWICLDTDAGRLWLASDEVGGGMIDDVTLAKTNGKWRDKDCTKLTKKAGVLTLPYGLKLNLREAEIVHKLGKPNQQHAEDIGFTYERAGTKKAPSDYGSSLWVDIEHGKATVLAFGASTSN